MCRAMDKNILTCPCGLDKHIGIQTLQDEFLHNLGIVARIQLAAGIALLWDK